MMNIINANTSIEYTIQFILCFCFIGSIDKIINKTVLSLKARWFFLHIFVNLIVTIFSYNDTKYCLTDPINCFVRPWDSSLPFMIASVSHIYHIIAFSNLHFDDYLHHITMGPFAGGIAFLFLKVSGTNLALMGLTGIPGGLDYVMLTLVKTGFIDRLIEKKWNVVIQTWFRMPLLIFGASIFYVNYIVHQLSHWSILCGMLAYWNGIYYQHDTLSNYYSKHYHLVKQKIN